MKKYLAFNYVYFRHALVDDGLLMNITDRSITSTKNRTLDMIK